MQGQHGWSAKVAPLCRKLPAKEKGAMKHVCLPENSSKSEFRLFSPPEACRLLMMVTAGETSRNCAQRCPSSSCLSGVLCLPLLRAGRSKQLRRDPGNSIQRSRSWKRGPRSECQLTCLPGVWRELPEPECCLHLSDPHPPRRGMRQAWQMMPPRQLGARRPQRSSPLSHPHHVLCLAFPQLQ